MDYLVDTSLAAARPCLNLHQAFAVFSVRFAICLPLFSVLLLLPAEISAQYSTHDLRRGVDRADRLVASTENRKALKLADSLTVVLQNAGMMDSPLGLDLLLVTATAHGNSNRDSTAMAMLLHLREESRRCERWSTYVSTNLVLAQLYQKMKRGGSARIALDDAKRFIDTYALDSIYPAYALRMAYWHRSVSRDRDSAIQHAQRVIERAPLYADSVTLASGYLVMGYLTDIYPEQSIAYFQLGIALCRKLGDHVGVSYLFSGLATRMIAQQRYRQALSYNDSSIVAAQQAVWGGQESSTAISDALQGRGEIYYSLGRLDSAYHYMHEGHDLEIEILQEVQHQKALEVDARYNDHLKAARIAEQARQLRDEERRSWLLSLVVALGLILGLVLTFTTVRFGKLSRANREQAEELKKVNAAKSHFFANVSHELRTPLTLIQGPISSIREDDNLTERQRRLLELAIGNGEQLQGLIDQILALQRLEVGLPQVTTSPTLLLDYFRQSLDAFAPLAQQRQLSYSRQISIPPTAVAPLDQEKCRIILANLLANACKFTPQGGEVAVSIRYDSTTLTIAVRDTGPGIHPDDLPNVFDRFYQTKRTDLPAQGGTGIGLALCREYVNLFGGTIRVASRAGEGTTFFVRIPLEALRVAAAATKAPAKRPSPVSGVDIRRAPPAAAVGGKPRILVVEDNTDLLEYLQFILSGHYGVETARNGREALERLHHMPDCRLVLSDLMMPVMDGYALLKRLKSKEATRHLPVIMLTARGDAQDRLRALRIGVDDYLTKPFEEEELRLSISRLLSNQEVRATTEAELRGAGEPVPARSAADHEWLERFEAYVTSQIPNSSLTVPDLALEFNMSDSTLLRQVKRLTGLTTLQYVQDVRLNTARRHLEMGTHTSIGALAYAVGYRDARSFSRAFRNRFNKLPSEYPDADAGAK